MPFLDDLQIIFKMKGFRPLHIHSGSLLSCLKRVDYHQPERNQHHAYERPGDNNS